MVKRKNSKGIQKKRRPSGGTVGKRNYFMGYGILLHELPVVAKIRAKDATYSSSCVRIAKFGCREVIPLTHSGGSQRKQEFSEFIRAGIGL